MKLGAIEELTPDQQKTLPEIRREIRRLEGLAIPTTSSGQWLRAVRIGYLMGLRDERIATHQRYLRTIRGGQ